MLIRNMPVVVPMLLVALIASGCGTYRLMPTPVAFVGDPEETFANVDPADRNTTFEVFVVTNRKPSDNPRYHNNPLVYYTNTVDDRLRAAIVTIRMGGDRMHWAELIEQATSFNRSHNPPVEVTGMREIGELWMSLPQPFDDRTPESAFTAEQRAPAQEFARRINERLAAVESNDIFIFVHGFKTKFENNVRVAAEFGLYLNKGGVHMAFAWPSKDDLFAYEKDKMMAVASIRDFRLLLTFLAQQTDARRIHILGHSAGAPIVVQALSDLRLLHNDLDRAALMETCRIGQVILVAPDMDLHRFQDDVADRFPDIAQQTNVYMSTRDEALSFSKMIYGLARLGSAIKAISPQDLVRWATYDRGPVIDVAVAQEHHKSGVHHSYFHTNAWVNADIIMAVRYGLKPGDRGLVLPTDNHMWGFPEDYPQRVRAIARQLSVGN